MLTQRRWGSAHRRRCIAETEGDTEHLHFTGGRMLHAEHHFAGDCMLIVQRLCHRIDSSAWDTRLGELRKPELSCALPQCIRNGGIECIAMTDAVGILRV